MRALIALLLASLIGIASAAEAPPAADDPLLEKRVARLATELRCLVCQNQSLADSNADLAVDLRNQVREMLRAGRSDEEVRDFMVQRYGDFVLYKPPLKATTVLLWAGPFVLLVLAAAVLWTYLRRRSARIVERELTSQERARAQGLLSAREDRRA
jgi:cytochrome c-type biogenesis protein CcmH/NrfF